MWYNNYDDDGFWKPDGLKWLQASRERKLQRMLAAIDDLDDMRKGVNKVEDLQMIA